MSPKTPTAVYETIVQWLKEKENFLLITGSAGFKTAVVSGKKLKKKDAYEKLRIGGFQSLTNFLVAANKFVMVASLGGFKV